MKKKLEQFKELYDFFANRAEKIAELKNEYTYDYKSVCYDGDEWEVTFTTSYSSCGSDEETFIYITNDEILYDFDDIISKLKEEKEAKERKAKERQEAYDKAEKKRKEKLEYEQYKKLKEKYED